MGDDEYMRAHKGRVSEVGCCEPNKDRQVKMELNHQGCWLKREEERKRKNQEEDELVATSWIGWDTSSHFERTMNMVK